MKIFINDNLEFIKGEYISRIVRSDLIDMKVKIPDESLFFWPNREGELIKSQDIQTVLEEHKLKEASICYPATASMFLFIIYSSKEKTGTIFYSKPDANGKIALFSLCNRNGDSYLEIKANGIDIEIKNYVGETFDEFINNFILDFKYSSILPKRLNNSAFQVQLGFFSPYGEHHIPESKGFEVCVDVAKNMKKYIGINNILHMFSYHGAHDSNYPEYFPSAKLGGNEGLKHAISRVHEQGQLCSLYMNARLFSANLLSKYPELEDSIIRDNKDCKVIETYYDRDFYVMDPLSLIWRSLLKGKAKFLKSIGADIIQLDQVAGRAAIGDIGYKWGLGYSLLIKEIESLGLEVWIQGINELYPANRFELCFRKPNILEDGTIRGGHPFGISYPLVTRILSGQNFIVPVSCKELLDYIPTPNVITDLEHLPGELSLYSKHYMDNLINNLKEQNENGRNY